jgi:hypothetical protein
LNLGKRAGSRQYLAGTLDSAGFLSTKKIEQHAKMDKGAK